MRSNRGIKWCSTVWIRGWRSGAWIRADQALAWCGEWCGVPKPCCRHCAFSACYAYQISQKTEQKRSLNSSLWLVGVSTKWYLTRVGSGRTVSVWLGA
ncbi:MAG: hypothetical protein ITD46_02575 [Nitrosospira sp.]|nr:hypothetical protein [Nitrosospira sp.]